LATFYTVGHSTHTVEAFIRLLKQVDTELAIDVRTVPRSRYNPQFNTDVLPQPLGAAGIGYRHMPVLGALRHAPKGAGPSPNRFWDNENFRNYADYTASREFQSALEDLRALGHEQVCTLFCAETAWKQCHRQIVADYLLAANETVIHIMGEGQFEQAGMTGAAVLGADGVIVYPAAQGDLLL
jgi:uncharacterized protein (DUF488 family)